MKATALAVTACIILMTCGVNASWVTTTSYIELYPSPVWVIPFGADKSQIRVLNDAFNKVCFELRDVDCSGIPVPKLAVFARQYDRPGLMGFYKGGNTIYVRQDLQGGKLEEVIAHEISHYIDTFTEGLKVPGKALPICQSEKRAWAVSDEYHRIFGDPKRIVGSKWVDWYSHCRPYRKQLYPEVDFSETDTRPDRVPTPIAL